MVKINTIGKKMLFTLIPLAVFSFVIIGILVTNQAKSSILKEISDKANTQAQLTKQQIENNLSRHKMLPILLAETVKNIGVSAETKEALIDLTKEFPNKNPDTLGTGIFMGKQYDGEWFCPYSYKVDGKIVYSTDYFVDNTGEGWYTIGDTKELVAWSAPYFDPASGITMITATSPIRDAGGNLLGVATGDMDFSNVQKVVNDIVVGKSGYAMLITGDGSYLAKHGEDVVAGDDGMYPNIKEDVNSSLAKAGEKILSTGEGDATFTDLKGEKCLVYYSTLQETGWIVLVVIPEVEVMKSVNEMLIKIVIATLLAVGFFVAIIALIARGVSNPIKKLQRSIEHIASGDLTTEIHTRLPGEIGAMAHDLEVMRLSLHETISEVAKTSEDLAASSEELSASAEQNGQASEQVAISVTGVSEGSLEIEKVSSGILDTTEGVVKVLELMIDGVTQASKLLDMINQNARNGNAMAENAVVSMSRTETTIEKSTVAMHELTEESKRIGSIVDAIKEIAEQTNLLALNASIEAARAGEAGRGFAVVADEIRKLAEQSNVSAEQISKIITVIQESIESVVTYSNESSSDVSKTGEAVTTTSQTFKEITNSIELTVDKMQDVLASVQTVREGTGEMSDIGKRLYEIVKDSAESIQSIAASAEEQSATTVEMTTATATLAGMATDLNEKIQKFKL